MQNTFIFQEVPEKSTKHWYVNLPEASLFTDTTINLQNVKQYLKNKMFFWADRLPSSSLIYSWFLSSFSEASKLLNTFLNLTKIHLSKKIVTFPCICLAKVYNLIPWMFFFLKIYFKTFIFVFGQLKFFFLIYEHNLFLRSWIIFSFTVID